MRRAVEDANIPHPGLEPPGRVTISVGVTVWGPTEGGSDSALRSADEALYVAKTGGRNRVAASKAAA